MTNETEASGTRIESWGRKVGSRFFNNGSKASELGVDVGLRAWCPHVVEPWSGRFGTGNRVDNVDDPGTGGDCDICANSVLA
jgi:hypothetical protein